MPRLARAGIRAVTYRTAAPVSTPAVPIGQVDATDARARPSGLDELDRVLGGGLGPGAVLLLAGGPRGGKATPRRGTGAPGAGAGEPLVDVVLHLDGDRHSQLRMVRGVKNRYGPTDEVGCFDLGEYGLIGLPDPSGLFLSQHREPVPGTCVTVTLEGRRPLPAEVQALVGNSVLEVPRLPTARLDAARAGLVLGVLQRRAGAHLGRQDVYAATVGGGPPTDP